MKKIFMCMVAIIMCSMVNVNANFSLDPLTIVLEPSGKNAQQWITIQHNGSSEDPIAVDLSVLKRDVTLDGMLVHNEKSDEDGEENFGIYPAQIILFPNETQTAYIQWLGDQNIDKELVYSLIAQQMPISDLATTVPEGKAVMQIRTLIKYDGIVFVRPSGISPHVVVESSECVVDQEGNAKLVITLNNTGSARQKLKSMKMVVTPLDDMGKESGKSVAYAPEYGKEVVKHSLYAGYRRRLEFPWPENVAQGAVKVAVNF